MNPYKATCLLLIILLFGSTAQAQTKAQTEKEPHRVPVEVMNTEFKPLDSIEPIKLANYNDQIVVLALWAYWCTPCTQAISGLDDFGQEFAGRGVKVIGLTQDDPQTDALEVDQVLRQYKWRMTLGWIDEKTVKLLPHERAVVPYIYVITKDGVIVEEMVGFHPERTIARLKATVERLSSNETSVHH